MFSSLVGVTMNIALFIFATIICSASFAQNATVGTDTANGLDIKTNNVTAMTIDTSQNVGIGGAAGTEKLTVTGNVALATANSKFTGATGLTFEATGDSFGTVRLNMQNRNGVNGAMFEQAGSVDLVDFVFKGLTNQRNIRYEARAASDFVLAPEFQIGAAADPGLVIADALTYVRKGSLTVNTATASARVHANNTTANTNTFLASNGATQVWKVLAPAGGATVTYNAANAVQYVGRDTGTSRSINAAGTINASGADFAEWVDWSGPKPVMGSVILYRGSYVVVSSPETAAFVGNDIKDPEHAILIAFAGQLQVRVRGVVRVGDLIVANDDGTARAVRKSDATIADAYRAVGTAWGSSRNSGLKRVHVAVGIGLAGGLNEIQQIRSDNQKLKEENNLLKVRLDRLEKLL